MLRLKKIFRSINNNKGAALVAVVISMVVLMILGTASLQSGLADTTFSINNEKEIQAEYIAKSGAEITAKYISDYPTTTLTSFSDTLGTGNYYAVVTKPSSSSIKIMSTGTVGSFSKNVSLILSGSTYQTLFTGIRQTGTDDLNLSAMDVDYAPGSTVSIEANVATLNQITLSTKNGDNDSTDPNIKRALNNNEPFPFVLPNIAGFQTSVPALVSGTRTFTGNYYLDTLSKVNNQTLIFNTQGGEQHIIVNSLSLIGSKAADGSSNSVIIQGGGNVHIYILVSGDIQTPVKVNTSNLGTMFIYVSDGKTLSLNANDTINAYIYAPKATVSIQSGTTINGAIIGEIINRGNVNGANGTLYYVPLANNPGDTAISPSYKKTVYLK